jgi:hypothetical protein
MGRGTVKSPHRNGAIGTRAKPRLLPRNALLEDVSLNGVAAAYGAHDIADA